MCETRVLDVLKDFFLKKKNWFNIFVWVFSLIAWYYVLRGFTKKDQKSPTFSLLDILVFNLLYLTLNFGLASKVKG